MKKAFTVLVCVMALAAFLVGSAQATWMTTKVVQCGITSFGQYYVQVQDPTNFTTATYFQLDNTNPNVKGWYAALLTAWSTGGNIFCDFPSTAAWSTIAAVSVSN